MAANAQPTRALNLTTEKTPTESIVRCTGQVVTETVPQLRETARTLISESKRVVLDFTGVNYLDSSGLGMIVGLYLSSKGAGCQLKLINLSPRVKELLSITRLAEVLESHAKEEMFGITPD